MASDERQGDTGAGGDRRSAAAADPKPVFWKELYWFALICLGGWTLAVLVLSPRLSRLQSARELEGNLRLTVARLSDLEQQYEAAIQALEEDPFYREETIRAVLKVKKSNEEFLKESPGS